MDKRWSVWLAPCESDRIHLQKLIKDYYARFNSPVFEPHLTLFGRVETDPVFTLPFFNNLVKDTAPTSLKVTSVKTGIPPWKALFLQMENNKELIQFQREIDLYFKGYRPYKFEPHLSLAYGNFAINKFELDNISFPETITFSSVALGTTPDEITDWKIINRLNLGERASP